MKNLFLLLFFFALLSFQVKAQDEDVYRYKSTELVVKPKPTDEFIEWMKQNNKLLGKKAGRNTAEETKVTLRIEIDAYGHIRKPGIWIGIGQGYDEVAFFLLKKNPEKWHPGKNHLGEAVTTELYFQIDFMENKNKIVSSENVVFTELY